MTSSTQFQDLLGKWSGTKRLWLSPDADEIRSESRAQVSSVAQGQFIVLSYTWETEDEPQDGMIVFPSGPSETATKSVWIDSWHMRNDVMVCDGTREESTMILRGSYSTPPGLDWGWRIEINVDQASYLTIRMFNITPEGQEALAALIQHERIADTQS
jgi:hypothetical protein